MSETRRRRRPFIIHEPAAWAGLLAASFGLAFMAFFAGPVRAQSDDRNVIELAGARIVGTRPLGVADTDLLSQLHLANQAQIDAAQLALARALDPAMRVYGQELVTTHSIVDAKIQELASARGAKLEELAPQGAREHRREEAEHHASMNELGVSAGHDFDQHFAHLTVRIQRDALAAAEARLETTVDEDVAQLLGQLVPILRRQLAAAEVFVGSSTTAARLDERSSPP